MPLLLAALLILLAALGLQLAMVVGVLRPSLLLALLGYAGLFAGMALILPAALRRAQRPGKQARADRKRTGKSRPASRAP